MIKTSEHNAIRLTMFMKALWMKRTICHNLYFDTDNVTYNLLMKHSGIKDSLVSGSGPSVMTASPRHDSEMMLSSKENQSLGRSCQWNMAGNQGSLEDG